MQVIKKNLFLGGVLLTFISSAASQADNAPELNINVIAEIGTEYTDVSLSGDLNGVVLYRTTQEDCDYSSFATCDNGTVEVLSSNNVEIRDFNITQDRPSYYKFETDTSERIVKVMPERTLPPLMSPSVVTFNNEMVVTGGYTESLSLSTDEVKKFTGSNFLWSSNNGSNWQKEGLISNGNSSIRLYELDGALFGLGAGFFRDGDCKASLLKSIDKVNWEYVNEISNLSKLVTVAPHVCNLLDIKKYNNQLIGTVNSDDSVQFYTSQDGLNWQFLSEIPSTPRDEKGALTISDSNVIWYLDGDIDAEKSGNLWRSVDGLEWELIGITPKLEDTTTSLLAYNEALVIVGVGDLGYMQVWSSSDGALWELKLNTPDIVAREHFSVHTFDTEVYIVGGSYLNSDDTSPSKLIPDYVWSSKDLSDWKQLNSPVFFPNNGKDIISYGDKFWYYSDGISNGGSIYGIWNSPDGIQWSQVSPDVPQVLRRGGSVVSFKGKLWAYGTLSQNEYAAYSSLDGINWNLENDSLPERISFQGGIVEHDGGLWATDASMLRKVWTSTNGADWDLVSENRNLMYYTQYKIQSFKNRLWLLGGTGTTNKSVNQIRFSYGGSYWYKSSTSPEFPARNNAKIIEVGDKLWLTGGYSPIYPNLHDVWVSSNGRNWDMVSNDIGFNANSLLYIKDKFVATKASYDGEYPIVVSDNGINWKLLSLTSFSLAATTHTIRVFDSTSGVELSINNGISGKAFDIDLNRSDYNIENVSGTCGGSLTGTTYSIDTVTASCDIFVIYEEVSGSWWDIFFN
jgi:hypothetical protein